MTMFKDQDKDNKAFQFMHCWNLLRNQVKWHDKRKQITDQKQPSNKKQKASTDSSPGTSTVTNVDTSNNAISDNAPAETDGTKRPMAPRDRWVRSRSKNYCGVKEVNPVWRV
uniref:No apical meristem-associated C-terminal domain-containing protein n=1 Tax=Arundo donax TaxID=35708 RepID=A0A0A9ELF0_ARUDO